MTTTDHKENLMPNIDLTIDPLHPAIIASYKGGVHGDDHEGVYFIEFPTMHHAAAWACTCEVENRVRIDRVTYFDCPVLIKLLPAFTSLPSRPSS